MQTELVLNALEAALAQRKSSSEGLLFHSDRGSQYTNTDYQSFLRDAWIEGSMSRHTNFWDNAVAESFFGTTKTEFIHTQRLSNQAEAKT